MAELVDQHRSKQQQGGDDAEKPIRRRPEALVGHGEVAERQRPGDQKEGEQPRVVDSNVDARDRAQSERALHYPVLSDSAILLLGPDLVDFSCSIEKSIASTAEEVAGWTVAFTSSWKKSRWASRPKVIDKIPLKAIGHSFVLTLRKWIAATISSGSCHHRPDPITNTGAGAVTAGWKNVSTPTATPTIPPSTSVYKCDGSKKQDQNVERDARQYKRGHSEKSLRAARGLAELPAARY